MKIRKRISLILAAVMSLTLLAGTALETNAADYDVSFIKRIPLKDKLTTDIDEKGTLETLNYTTHAYSTEEAEGKEILIEKTLQVYLPYGYDPAQQYNVFYITHGSGESEYYWLNDTPVYEGTKAMGKTTKAVINNAVANGVGEPMIFVSVTSVTNVPTEETSGESEGEPNYDTMSLDFAKELRNDILPFIEAKYSTYANGDVSEENLIATREHRGFAGFSGGAAVTVRSVMMENLDMFAYFGTYSGAYSEPEEFKEALESFGTSSEFPVKYWFNGNGTSDFAYEGHYEFCQNVLEIMPDWFEDGVNYAWIEYKGGSHAYNCWIAELYNCMLVFFK